MKLTKTLPSLSIKYDFFLLILPFSYCKYYKVKSVCEENNFKSIYKEHSRPLRNFIYYRCGDVNKAEDIVQDSMISLWQNCAKVLFEKAKSFLYTVAMRNLIDNVRHEKVKLQFVKQSVSINSPDPHHQLQEKEFKTKLENAISELPEGQREAFLMNRIDKKSYAEIAEILDISVKGVEKRMHLALVNLKEKVSELKTFKI